MLLLKGFTLIALALGAWRSFKAMGRPVVRGGKKWYLQPDGRYRRWYGGWPRSEQELPPEDL